MHTQSATAMTTMLASTAATNDSSWLQAPLGLGLWLVIVALVLWIFSIFSSDAPAPGDPLHRKQRKIRAGYMAIGLLIAVPCAIVLYM